VPTYDVERNVLIERFVVFCTVHRLWVLGSLMSSPWVRTVRHTTHHGEVQYELVPQAWASILPSLVRAVLPDAPLLVMSYSLEPTTGLLIS